MSAFFILVRYPKLFTTSYHQKKLTVEFYLQYRLFIAQSYNRIQFTCFYCRI